MCRYVQNADLLLISDLSGNEYENTENSRNGFYGEKFSALLIGYDRIQGSYKMSARRGRTAAALHSFTV